MGNADYLQNLPGLSTSICNSFGPLLEMFHRLEIDNLLSNISMKDEGQRNFGSFLIFHRPWENTGQSYRKKKIGEAGIRAVQQTKN